MALYFTPRQVADRWSCSPGHVRRLCASGELVAMRLGDLWRISVAAVEAYERRQTSEPPAPTAAPAPKEVTHTTSADGFALPADYAPVFPALWPGHEPQNKKKRPSAVTEKR